MKMIDFNNKTFLLRDNSNYGTVTDDTIFKYTKKGSLITATYYGGSIRYGKIIAN